MFDPRLLAKLIGRVIVSDLFGQYADRRLIVAALDTVADDELVQRARQFMPKNADKNVWSFEPDATGAIWVDFVADLGDGFDATYAIATLLAQEILTVDGHLTRRGQVLVMGGDEVYPNASAENYQKRLRDPTVGHSPIPALISQGRLCTRSREIMIGTTGLSCFWRCSPERKSFISVDGGRISGGVISPFRSPRSGGSGRWTPSFTTTSTNRSASTSRLSPRRCLMTPRPRTRLALHR